jgi:hypothetical protein
MLSNKLNARRGFHPRRCGSPDAIPPGQVLRHHRSGRGGRGGQAHVPSFIPTSILKFISRKRNSTEPKKGVFFKTTQVLTMENPVYHGQGIKVQVRQSRDMSMFLLTSLHLE